MKQTSSLTRQMTDAQIAHAEGKRAEQTAPAWNAVKTVFHIYTEFLASVDYAAIVARYFAGATLYRGIGLDSRTQADAEPAVIIEVVSSAPDALQRMVFLAGDLRVAGGQISVLLTQQPVTTFEITADSVPASLPLFPEASRQRADDVTDSPSINLRSQAQAHRFPL